MSSSFFIGNIFLTTNANPVPKIYAAIWSELNIRWDTFNEISVGPRYFTNNGVL